MPETAAGIEQAGSGTADGSSLAAEGTRASRLVSSIQTGLEHPDRIPGIQTTSRASGELGWTHTCTKHHNQTDDIHASHVVLLVFRALRTLFETWYSIRARLLPMQSSVLEFNDFIQTRLRDPDSEIPIQTSRFRHPDSNISIQSETSRFRHSNSDIPIQTSRLRHPDSDIPIQKSRFTHPDSDIPIQSETSRLRHPDSDIPI